MINTVIRYPGLLSSHEQSPLNASPSSRFGVEPVSTAATVVAVGPFMAPLIQYMLTGAAVAGGGGLLMTGHYARKLYQMATGKQEFSWRDLRVPKVRLEEATHNAYPQALRDLDNPAYA